MISEVMLRSAMASGTMHYQLIFPKTVPLLLIIKRGKTKSEISSTVNNNN